MASPVPVFTGFVEHGKLTIDNRRGFLEHARTFEGKEVEITITRRRSQRSAAQNRYFHAVPVELFREHWGTTVEVTKLLLMGECFGWDDFIGHRLPLKPSTSELTVEEFSRLIEFCIAWGATDWGLIVPMPNEVAD